MAALRSARSAPIRRIPIIRTFLISRVYARRAAAHLAPEGAVTRVIEETRSGRCARSKDVDTVADIVLDFYEQWNAGTLGTGQDRSTVEQFERKNVAGALAALLDDELEDSFFLDSMDGLLSAPDKDLAGPRPRKLGNYLALNTLSWDVSNEIVIDGAPVMLDYLDAESAEHFEELRELLGVAGIGYRLNPRLVRGLDYYNRTVFEWVTDALGSQGAVCSGGRYDGLVEKLGGRPTPAVGWAMGIERFVALFEACGGKAPDTGADVYVVAVGEGTLQRAVRLAEQLRDAVAGIRVELNLGGGSFKSQMKRADNSNAEYALILGERELSEGHVGLKPMRTRDEQTSVGLDEVASILAGKLSSAADGAGACED